MQPLPGHVVRLQLRPVSAIWGGMDTQTHSVRTALGRPRFTVICPSDPAVSALVRGSWCKVVLCPVWSGCRVLQILECLLWCVGPRHGDARCKVVLCLCGQDVRLGSHCSPFPSLVLWLEAEPLGVQRQGSVAPWRSWLSPPGQCWALGVHSLPLPPQTYSVEFHLMCLQEFFTVLRNHFFNHKLYCGN